MKIDTIIWLLPVTFMIHDFEEIIFLKYWMDKNEDYIMKRIPDRLHKYIPKIKNLSSASFASAVAEIFLIISLLTVYICENNSYDLFIALVVVNLLHLTGHFIQGIVIRKYIPAIGTGVLTSFYCIYAVVYFNKLNLFNLQHVMTIIPFVIIGTLVNLVFSHYIAGLINKVIEK